MSARLNAATFLGLIAWAGLLYVTNALKLVLIAHRAEVAEGLPVVVPSPVVARLAFLGQEMLAADVYWLRSLQYFGDKHYRSEHYPALVPMYDLVTTLDPEYCVVYHAAGLILTSSERFDLDAANRLLQKGTEACRDDWYIPFLLGFNAYYFSADPEAAGRALEDASRRPGAPEWIGAFAVRLLAHNGNLVDLQRMIATMLESTKDPAQRETLEGRLRKVRTERMLRGLDESVAAYHARFGAAPRDLKQIAAAGIIPWPLAPDPSGGSFYLDARGRPMSSAYRDRLELKADPAASRPAPGARP